MRTVASLAQSAVALKFGAGTRNVRYAKEGVIARTLMMQPSTSAKTVQQVSTRTTQANLIVIHACRENGKTTKGKLNAKHALKDGCKSQLKPSSAESVLQDSTKVRAIVHIA